MVFVYLAGSRELIAERLAARHGQSWSMMETAVSVVGFGFIVTLSGFV